MKILGGGLDGNVAEVVLLRGKEEKKVIRRRVFSERGKSQENVNEER